MIYRTLRQANVARQIEWDHADQLGPSFAMVELTGETGEAIEALLDMLATTFLAADIAGKLGKVANTMKKLERERLGIKGSRATKTDLAKELADLVICADLLAIKLDISLATAIEQKFNETSTKLGLVTKLDLTGAA